MRCSLDGERDVVSAQEMVVGSEREALCMSHQLIDDSNASAGQHPILLRSLQAFAALWEEVRYAMLE